MYGPSKCARGEGVRNFYDVWMPDLAPSAELVAQAKATFDKADWDKFVRKYRAEMAKPGASRVLDLLAALSATAQFSVGCYCEDESRCHRSVLRSLLQERGAAIA